MQTILQKILRQPWGNTPLFSLSMETIVLDEKLMLPAASISIKDESRNPSGSVKLRAAIAMLEAALQDGSLKKGGTIIEPTSGNTGIALAFIGAACPQLEFRVILTMPESMSIERRKLLAHFGAELILTPATEGMRGAISRAQQLLQEIPGSFMPDQFSNPAYPQLHYETTAEEIWKDCNGEVDVFIAGVGTGGTLTGVSRRLKEYNPKLISVAVEPAESAVLSGKPAGPHAIQGIGAGFIPKNLDENLVDTVLAIESERAVAMAQRLAKKEGLLCGISTGAAVEAAVQLAKREEYRGKKIVTILPDTGERYLGTALFAGS